jgi:hypothetical protein
LLLADRPEPAPQPAAASVVAAPDIPNETPTLDPRVAPFVTNGTDIIIAIDLTKIDLDALATDMRTELGKMQMDAPSAARLNGMIQMGLSAGKQWVNGFRQAGGTSMFLLSRADELKLDTTTNSPALKLTATIVYPTDSPDAAQILAKYLTRPGSRPPEVTGNAVVDPTSSPGLPQLGFLPDPRPALAAGLKAGGDLPVRVAVNPRKLGDIMPKLMASGSVSMDFPPDEWDNVENDSINLVLPPDQFPRFQIITHFNDPASAEASRGRAVQRIDRFLKSTPVTKSPLTASMLKFIATEKFAAKDSDVIATMDLHAYWDLLFSAIRNATQPPASQPPEPANGM